MPYRYNIEEALKAGQDPVRMSHHRLACPDHEQFEIWRATDSLYCSLARAGKRSKATQTISRGCGSCRKGPN